jgi:beta-glucosidase/6-phospho-beta-glucosidase/beta-galactosidase
MTASCQGLHHPSYRPVAVDNYEWLHGYDVQFGIIDRDRNIRPSARALQREAAA